MSLAERLAYAEEELAAFERQPPLGWRAYQSGRNSRMAVIEGLKAQSATIDDAAPVTAPAALCLVCGAKMAQRTCAHGKFAYCAASTPQNPHPTVALGSSDSAADYPWFEKFVGIKCSVCQTGLLPREGKFGGFMLCPNGTKEHPHPTVSAAPQSSPLELAGIGTELKHHNVSLSGQVVNMMSTLGVTATETEAHLLGTENPDTGAPDWSNPSWENNPSGEIDMDRLY